MFLWFNNFKVKTWKCFLRSKNISKKKIGTNSKELQIINLILRLDTELQPPLSKDHKSQTFDLKTHLNIFFLNIMTS